MAALKVNEAVRQAGIIRQGRSFRPHQCADLCASNYQCVGVLSKSWVCGSFCSSVSIVVCLKWDANVIYSAWHDAVREDWSL